MLQFVTLLHVMLCFTLILIILLQPGKDSASVFGGGGGNQMYGPRGQAHLLGRATTVVAALFMVTSITLAWYSSQSVREGSDIEGDILRLAEEEAEDDGLGFFEKAHPDEGDSTETTESPNESSIDLIQPPPTGAEATEGIISNPVLEPENTLETSL
jgi:preprotein translocase subunit SecG